MKKQSPGELSGVIPPIITPVDDEDRVDERAFRQLIRWLIKAGVHGLFVGGSAGEGPLLTLPQWVRMMEIAHDENRGAVPLLGGVMDTATRRIQERISILADIGYVYYVVTPVFYLRMTTPDDHLRLFGACREAGGAMEMIAYNIPVFTGAQIPVKTACDMARRGWIRYCKESSGDLPYFRRLVSEGTAAGLKVFMGDETAMAEGLRAGACGIVPGCANFEPQTFIRAYEAALRGDVDDLARWFNRMMTLREKLVLRAPCWLSGIKYAVACLGIGSGRPVSPLQPLTEEQQREVAEFVRQSAGSVLTDGQNPVMMDLKTKNG